MDFSIKTFSIDTLSCLFSTVSKIKNKHSAIKLTIDLLIKVCAKKKKKKKFDRKIIGRNSLDKGNTGKQYLL